MPSSEGGAISLQETPTWALATVCFVFIFLGVLIEHLIHLAGHWLKKHKKAALHEAMEKLKSVLMLLGFMSLILTVTQRLLMKICIPERVANSLLPCRKTSETSMAVQHLWTSFGHKNGIDASRQQRKLATESDDFTDHCSSGMSPLMSQEGINQLNILIFVLALLQVVSALATMAFGTAKMKKWKVWEAETQTLQYTIANDPKRFRFTRDTTFGRRHTTICETNLARLWIKCFLRQFFRSVDKVDYLTLRHSFIATHLSSNNSFNFRKYIQRCLEDDFKLVIGISPTMWLIVVIFLFLDVHGWNAYLWLSFVPLLIVLFIGTKLEVIVAKMAMQLTSQNTVTRGIPLLELNNNLFWFERPRLVLTLLHFVLFMNAFEFSFFLWVTWQFGIHSCYHEYVMVIVIRVVIAVLVQILCSYITLPLYALVTQMGSRYKRTILNEDTVNAIKQWHTNVKLRRNNHPILPNADNITDSVRLSGSEIVEDYVRTNDHHYCKNNSS